MWLFRPVCVPGGLGGREPLPLDPLLGVRVRVSDYTLVPKPSPQVGVVPIPGDPREDAPGQGSRVVVGGRRS